MKGTKIRLSLSPESGYDLDTLLADVEVDTPDGKEEKTKKEMIRFKSARGTGKMLREEAMKRGFYTMSEMIRSAIKFSLRDEDFRKGWDG